MKSPLALSEIHRLEAQGVRLSAEEVIRLNAFGLAVDIARGKRPVDDVALLPRLSQIAPDVSFRQPTLGHEAWLDAAERLVDKYDTLSVLALNCYALSRDQAELCDPYSAEEVSKSVGEYIKKLEPFCRDQLLAAIDYVRNGRDPGTGEKRALRIHDDEVSDDDRDAYLTADWDACVAIGMIHRGVAMLWGVSIADIRSMTRRQLDETIAAAAVYHGIQLSDDIAAAEARFYQVLEEITAAHEESAKVEGQGQGEESAKVEGQGQERSDSTVGP